MAILPRVAQMCSPLDQGRGKHHGQAGGACPYNITDRHRGLSLHVVEQVDTFHPGLYSKLTEYVGVSFLKDARCSEPWAFQN